MRRIGLAVALAVTLFATPLAAEGQQTGKVARLGQLGPGPPGCYSPPHPAEQGLRRGLEEAGYVINGTITIERRCFERAEQVPGLVKELLDREVNLLVVWSGEAALGAKRATTATPIVFIDPSDPIGTGLIASFAKPGGNATGLSSITKEIAAKRLEMLHELVPRGERIGVLMNPATKTALGQVDGVRTAATTLRLGSQLLPASTPTELSNALASINRQRLDAIFVVADPLFFVHQRRIVEALNSARLPAIYSHTDFVRSGGLIAYAADLVDMSRRAGTYIDKILKGVNPADLPVDQPTKFELAVNLKTAKALGLTIPESVLVRADQIIE